MNTPDNKGGRRAGAGRKPLHGVRMKTVCVQLPPEGIKLLDAQRGKVSRGEWVLGLLLKEDIRATLTLPNK